MSIELTSEGWKVEEKRNFKRRKIMLMMCSFWLGGDPFYWCTSLKIKKNWIFGAQFHEF